MDYVANPANFLGKREGSATPFIAPAFAQYDKHLAAQMTEWLYGDSASNPRWATPEAWPRSGTVAFVQRKVAFTDLDYGGSANKQTISADQLFGGKNAIVFAQAATVVSNPVAALATLPQVDYIFVSQTKGDGTYEIEEGPVNSNFGTVPGQPYMLPVPKFWSGSDARKFIATNYGDVTVGNVDLTLNFYAAVLDTAR